MNGVGWVLTLRNASNMKFCRESFFFGVLTQLLKVVLWICLVFLTLNIFSRNGNFSKMDEDLFEVGKHLHKTGYLG